MCECGRGLSRFELLRPEKRVFFTQDSGRFAFGGLDGDNPPLLHIFSRRTGPGQTLDAALKLSGTAGPVEFGALGVQVGRDAGDPSAAEGTPRLGVLRAATALNAQQRVGPIATQALWHVLREHVAGRRSFG